MKFSTTTLGFVLSLSAVMAAPLKERAVEVATVTETYTKVVQSTAVVWVAPPAKSEHPAAYSAKQYGYEPSSITTTHEAVVETSTPLSSIPSTLSTSSTSSFSSSSLSSSSTESTTSSSTESTSTEATTTTTTESTSTEANSTSTSSSTEATSTSTTSTAESTTSTTVEPTTSTTSQEPTTSSTSVSIPSTTIEIPTTTSVIPTFTPLFVPTTTQPAATSAVAKAVESAVSSGSGSGMYAGEMTYYTPGLGSCGITSGESDYIVAPSHLYMLESYSSGLNPNKNPKCGQQVMMTGPTGKQVPATIVDTCPGCNGMYDLDCTLELFKALGCTEIDGRCKMTWSPM